MMAEFRQLEGDRQGAQELVRGIAGKKSLECHRRLGFRARSYPSRSPERARRRGEHRFVVHKNLPLTFP